MIYVTGDIKYNTELSPLAEFDDETMEEFMFKIQGFMDLYAITRIDIAIDPYKYLQYKKEIV
jgi:hypothetical protein